MRFTVLAHRTKRLTLAALALAVVVASSGVRVLAEDFYTLASAQMIALRGGVAVRLTANGPVAFATLPDANAPPGVQRVRLRLYGVTGSTSAVGALDGASVSATPDGRGNLDVVITSALTLDAARPFEVKAGRGPNEIDVVLRIATH